MKIFSKKNVGLFFFVCAVFFFIFLYHSFQERGWFHSFLDRQHLIPKAETYTELYFTDSTHLPSVITKGDNIVFAFTIHNREEKSMEYPYEVVLISSREASTTLLLAKSTTTLANDKYKTVNVRLSFAKTPAPSLIAVRLPKSEKEIRFHVNKPN